ncbi:MAG: hypothetical protein ACYC7E_00105 [Armatimonadota bacterium]
MAKIDTFGQGSAGANPPSLESKRFLLPIVISMLSAFLSTIIICIFGITRISDIPSHEEAGVLVLFSWIASMFILFPLNVGFGGAVHVISQRLFNRTIASLYAVPLLTAILVILDWISLYLAGVRLLTISV